MAGNFNPIEADGVCGTGLTSTAVIINLVIHEKRTLMMNIFAEIRNKVIDELKAMSSNGELPEGLDFHSVSLEPPRDAAHGDMATNAALVLSKQSGRKPREIAATLAKRLSDDPRIKRSDIAGAGFINMQLSEKVLQKVLTRALEMGNAYGRSAIGAYRKVNVEFVSANPTGPLHVGHTRGAVFGDSLANLLEYSGFDVTREYYINDGGAQVDTLARSLYQRYLQTFGRTAIFDENSYPGDYLVPVAEKLKDQFGDAFLDQPEEIWLSSLREFAINSMMDAIKKDLADIGISMDVYFSEKSLYGTGRIEEAIAELDKKGLVYEGVLEPPKGKLPEDWEAREQTLFKSTLHGDDVDRPVKKSDGNWTYFAPDIAYHYDKTKRGFDMLIDIFGADHAGYVKRMKAAVSGLSGGRVMLDIKLIELVRLFKEGKPLKMSKRSGAFVTLRDVVDEVGPDVTRFVMLTRRNDSVLDFDFDKVLEQSRENPVFYVQYAHARIKSVLRNAKKSGINVSDTSLLKADFSRLSHEMQRSLVKKLAEWPRIVELASKTFEPHRIALYLNELSAVLHSLWNLGNNDGSMRFIDESDHDSTLAKIALVSACAIVISSGLGILGVKPVNEMR